jgi:hypothetical protein
LELWRLLLQLQLRQRGQLLLRRIIVIGSLPIIIHLPHLCLSLLLLLLLLLLLSLLLLFLIVIVDELALEEGGAVAAVNPRH